MPAWNDRVTTALAAARRRGITVDLAIGPVGIGASPAIPLDGPGVATELVYGQIVVAGGSPFHGAVLLNPSSLVDLTSSVRDGQLTWTPPTAGQWLLFGFWQRGTGQSVVVDHYSTAGADTITRFWDETLLTPAVRQLLRDVGGDLFQDSLELQFVLPWTANMLEHFHHLRGYALTKYLPVVFIERLTTTGSSTPAPGRSTSR